VQATSADRPKRTKWREWPRRPSILGFYLPLAEPRPIPEGALIHGSVFERIAAVPDYRPVNLPAKRERTGKRPGKAIAPSGRK
jgi:hypothetical protein